MLAAEFLDLDLSSVAGRPKLKPPLARHLQHARHSLYLMLSRRRLALVRLTCNESILMLDKWNDSAGQWDHRVLDAKVNGKTGYPRRLMGWLPGTAGTVIAAWPSPWT